jgi:hypothetical protein
MSPEKEMEKLKRDLAKSRAEIAALQRKLQASLLKKGGQPSQKPANKTRNS